ncbi:MAG: hypothetical protein LC799_08500 [Actinobacteria bacterium]|nr:hypothetical protein [Actinomycetota bacterium]
MEFDDALETELRTLARADGATKPLAELLPGEWDTVHILLGPATKERIEREIGQPVELSGSGVYDDTYMQDGNLLVLRKAGEIVRMVSTGQLAVLPTGVFTSEVTLHSADGSIRIRNPDGSQAQQGRPWPVGDR